MGDVVVVGEEGGEEEAGGAGADEDYGVCWGWHGG